LAVLSLSIDAEIYLVLTSSWSIRFD
jgi:hypothetical protein